MSEQICGFQCLHRDMPDVCVCTELWVSVSAQKYEFHFLHRGVGVSVFSEMGVSVFSQRCGFLCAVCEFQRHAES